MIHAASKFAERYCVPALVTFYSLFQFSLPPLPPLLLLSPFSSPLLLLPLLSPSPSPLLSLSLSLFPSSF
ncbi:hypothetical protein ACQJ1P_26600, partial [Klebsiella pneumoniae]|uniref:hypothetical protein n=1 Tax=Klebsiella pneumoniae TaxID=573 RepID=UPI003CFEDE4C